MCCVFARARWCYLWCYLPGTGSWMFTVRVPYTCEKQRTAMMFLRGFCFRTLLLLSPLGLAYRTTNRRGSSHPELSLHDRPKRSIHPSPLCFSSVDVSSGTCWTSKVRWRIPSLGKPRFGTAALLLWNSLEILEVGPRFCVACGLCCYYCCCATLGHLAL